MKSVRGLVRFNSQDRMNEVGYTWTGWDESRHYEFSEAEVLEIEEVTNGLSTLLHEVTESIIFGDSSVMDRMGVPRDYQSLIRTSWHEGAPSVSTRLDLARDTHGVIKLIEVNGDTPTTLIESALLQWFWLEDRFPELAKEAKQFNSLHENLLQAWKNIALLVPSDDWFAFSAHSDSLEEYATCEYYRDLATQAGLRTGFVDINPRLDRAQFLYHPGENVFHEPGGEKINYWYKLYPWEWLWQEEFGAYIPNTNMGIVEPPWKIVQSNKLILSELYKRFPDHPNLVPAFDTNDTRLGSNFVEKPVWGREGTGIKMVRNGEVITDKDAQTPDPTASMVAPMYQQLIDVEKVDSKYVQIGSWLIEGNASGMIIRDSDTPIITGNSAVVPHLYR